MCCEGVKYIEVRFVLFLCIRACCTREYNLVREDCAC